MNRSRSSRGQRRSSMRRRQPLQQRRQQRDEVLAVLARALRLHAPDEVLDAWRRPGPTPRSPRPRRGRPAPASRSSAGAGTTPGNSAPGRSRSGARSADFATTGRQLAPVASRRSPRRWTGCWRRRPSPRPRETRSSIRAQLLEDREVVGEAVENPVDDLVDLAVERVVVPHRRRPAEARLRQRVDEQPRRMALLREERAVEHRGLEHRNLQPREQRLDAVGQVAGLEDEVEQHRDELDRHRLELVHPLAERRLLQVAQDVVLALRDAGEARRACRRRDRSRSRRPAAGRVPRPRVGVAMIGAPGT